MQSRPWKGRPAIKVTIPLRALVQELEDWLPLGEVARDLPRGRKRPGWKRDFLRALRTAAKDLGDISDDDIAQAVKSYRRKTKSRPEITVVGATEASTA